MFLRRMKKLDKYITSFSPLEVFLKQLKLSKKEDYPKNTKKYYPQCTIIDTKFGENKTVKGLT